MLMFIVLLRTIVIVLKNCYLDLKTKFPRLVSVLADQAYQGNLQKWFYEHTRGCLLSIIKPKEETKGFKIQQWIWLVERSFAWLGNFRRLSKDYEISVSSSKAFIQLAFAKIMLNRLAKYFPLLVLSLVICMPQQLCPILNID